MGFVLKPNQPVSDPIQEAEEYKQEIIALSVAESEAVKEIIESKPKEVVEVPQEQPEEEETQGLFLDELMILARCVEAEAGNQDILGKRLVVDVILNRVDSPLFPDDIVSVIYQDSQFSVVDNGMIDIVEPSETTLEAINLELEHRTDSTVLYFCTGGFHSWCTPDYQHGAHYFGH